MSSRKRCKNPPHPLVATRGPVSKLIENGASQPSRFDVCDKLASASPKPKLMSFSVNEYLSGWADRTCDMMTSLMQKQTATPPREYKHVIS